MQQRQSYKKQLGDERKEKERGARRSKIENQRKRATPVSHYFARRKNVRGRRGERRTETPKNAEKEPRIQRHHSTGRQT